jgi:glycosyltransferase involved in cell wall biosynthesis
MKILMLAPEPFFQPRGTPISVYFRIKALSDWRHEVDLITYPLGENVNIERLKILRIPNLFLLKKIKIGPSFIKPPLDILLFSQAVFRLARKRYDAIFTHEEAALLGAFLGKIFRVPHIYDMHSSLPQQLENFNFSRSRLLKAIFIGMENYYLKNSQAVIVICQDLLEKVRRDGYESKAILIENFLDFPSPEFSAEQSRAKRLEFAPHGEKIVLYAGNFQPYQGIPLLLEAAAKLNQKVIFVLVGGVGEELEEMKNRASALAISDRVVFVDKVPPSSIPLFISLADVLVSPRLSGTNTPLKIYSYLKSGKPLVATNLWTHTQVLNEKISVLVNPTPESLAQGLSFALSSEEANERAREAKELSEREYTYSNYLNKIRHCLEIAYENFKTKK